MNTWVELEDTFRFMVWGGLCRNRLLVITPQHLRRGAEPVLVPEKGLGEQRRWGLSPKEEALGSTGRAVGMGRSVVVTRRFDLSLQPFSHLSL